MGRSEVKKMGSKRLAEGEEGLPGMGKGDTVKLALARRVRREMAMEPVMDGAAVTYGPLAPRLGPFV
jgi:hypothetical protein